MLYEVAAFDPVILAATVALLCLVGLVAGFAPALRAASVQPVVALRSE
jgi:ABC-type antimicrobial peptide transport system permease subunit